MSNNLTKSKALIFRIMHKDNVPWVMDHGLHCKNSTTTDPNYVDIGNQELIAKRAHRPVPPPWNGTLSDYVSFYFTPFSPMLYNIRTGWGGIEQRENEEIVIVVSSLPRLQQVDKRFVFTDRHAYLAAARFSSDMADLDWIDWPLLQQRDFRKDDVDKFERYQAEALVHKHLPINALIGIVCYNDSVATLLKEESSKRKLSIQIDRRPEWYFQ